MVLDADRLPVLDSAGVGIPVTVFEVLSSTTADRDRREKTDRYLRAGVPEVWLVDPASESIEIRLPEGSDRATGTTRLESRALPGVALVPRKLFAR